jgi:hypothetical protein
VDVEHMLQMLDMENLRREGMYEYRFSCPYPGHDNGDMNASAYMNLETTNWFCHGCKRHGTAITFVASLLSISPIKSKKLLREAYDPASLDPDKRIMAQEIRNIFAKAAEGPQSAPQNVPISDLFLERFDVDWEMAAAAGDEAPECFRYMLQERGFAHETLEHWSFGYDERTNRITFPVCNERGEIVGFKGRSWDGRFPKYLVLGDADDADPYYGFGRFYTGSLIFGLDLAISEGDATELIVCEGELNAIALWEMGYRNAVALNGSNLTSRQARLIRTYADRVIFFFDFDKAGLEGMWGRDDEKGHHLGALEILARDLSVFLVGSHDADPADMMRDGREAEVDALIREADSYLVAKLRSSVV